MIDNRHITLHRVYLSEEKRLFWRHVVKRILPTQASHLVSMTYKRGIHTYSTDVLPIIPIGLKHAVVDMKIILESYINQLEPIN